jgi:hypothetical protein
MCNSAIRWHDGVLSGGKTVPHSTLRSHSIGEMYQRVKGNRSAVVSGAEFAFASLLWTRYNVCNIPNTR